MRKIWRRRSCLRCGKVEDAVREMVASFHLPVPILLYGSCKKSKTLDLFDPLNYFSSHSFKNFSFYATVTDFHHKH